MVLPCQVRSCGDTISRQWMPCSRVSRFTCCGEDQAPLPRCTLCAGARSPLHSSRPSGGRAAGGEPQPPAGLSSATQPLGCSGAARSRLPHQRLLILPPAESAVHPPQRCHQQWELWRSGELHPALLPRVGAGRRFAGEEQTWWGAPWQGACCRAARTVLPVLLVAPLAQNSCVAGACVVAGAGEQWMGWRSWEGRHGPSQLWDTGMRLLPEAVETHVQVRQKERSHSQIACIFLNSFTEWRLPFIPPPPRTPCACAHCWHSLPILYNNSQVSASHCLPVEPRVTGPPAQSHEKLHARV